VGRDVSPPPLPTPDVGWVPDFLAPSTGDNRALVFSAVHDFLALVSFGVAKVAVGDALRFKLAPNSSAPKWPLTKEDWAVADGCILVALVPDGGSGAKSSALKESLLQDEAPSEVPARARR